MDVNVSPWTTNKLVACPCQWLRTQVHSKITATSSSTNWLLKKPRPSLCSLKSPALGRSALQKWWGYHLQPQGVLQRSMNWITLKTCFETYDIWQLKPILSINLIAILWNWCLKLTTISKLFFIAYWLIVCLYSLFRNYKYLRGKTDDTTRQPMGSRQGAESGILSRPAYRGRSIRRSRIRPLYMGKLLTWVHLTANMCWYMGKLLTNPETANMGTHQNWEPQTWMFYLPRVIDTGWFGGTFPF